MTKTSDQEEDKTSKSGHGSVFAIYRNPPAMRRLSAYGKSFQKTMAYSIIVDEVLMTLKYSLEVSRK